MHSVRGPFLRIGAIGLMLFVFCAAALAQPAEDQTRRAAPERPVYIDVMPVADAGNSILPDDVVAAMASEALSGARQASIRMHGQDLPSGVRVLRVMYIVHEQPEADGVTLAASASTELLRTVATGNGEMQTLSVYNGLQQTLVSGPDMERAQSLLRDAFKKELQARIDSAFQRAEAL
ncbi:hypothetical protein [Salinisphaera sp. T31B1]|uniref:hypothetical protein n=1 Tax=Salinisphaera sp. T31B1 TaxID=727963 RepID=UPI003341CCAD